MASTVKLDVESTYHDDKGRPPSIVYGPAAPVPLTMTFSELLDYHAEVRGDRPAIIAHPQDGRIVSFKQLRERSIRLARAMSKDGIRNGDLVAISLGSRIEYFETFFACTYLGAALVLLNYAYAESEMLALLKIVSKCQGRNEMLLARDLCFPPEPKMLVIPPGFTFYDYTKVLPKIAEQISSVEKFVIIDDLAGKYQLSGQLDRSVGYEEYLEPFDADASVLPEVSISPHDMVNVQFTSGKTMNLILANDLLIVSKGSTGLPKSVALSHYNIMNCGRYIWQQTRMSDQDRVCLPVPLFHSFGMIVGKSQESLIKAQVARADT